MNQDPEKDYRSDKRRFLRNRLILNVSPSKQTLEVSKLVSREEYEQGKAWGLLTSIDLQDCDVQIIRDAEKIKEYVRELCALIEMKRFGETSVVDFGEDPEVTGFSMTQLIETSLISGHFGNENNGKFAYLDIFSCKWYDQLKAIEFTKKFFKAKQAKFNVVIRGKE